jgi:cytosine/adenosine deaminase-related metal-dependent hydrolase
VLIKGARMATGCASTAGLNLWTCNGVVSFTPTGARAIPTIDLKGFLILPGLINAHDHLELNLFPKLGRGPYTNASAWARDIYRPHEPPIKEQLYVPKELRLRWGGIKNLVSGVTTVAHHNAFHPVFLDPDFPVRVVRRYGWAHSLHFSHDWKARFERTPASYPFVIHAAEGVDDAARREIRLLARSGVLDSRTVLVHAVAMDADELALARACAGVVWCPTSNHFLFGRSLDRSALKSALPIALGSDSAITGDGDLLDELRFAQQTVDAFRLYRMVTCEAARMFKLPSGFGRICNGGPADLLVIRDTGTLPAVALLESYPELVLVKGQIRLVSAGLAERCPPEVMDSLEAIEVEGRGIYFVAAPVSTMLKQTKRLLQRPARLAGKEIAA